MREKSVWSFIFIINSNKFNRTKLNVDSLAGNHSSEVVGADTDVGGVGHTPGSVGHSVAKGGVGGGDTSSVGVRVASVAISSIAQVVAKT